MKNLRRFCMVFVLLGMSTGLFGMLGRGVQEEQISRLLWDVNQARDANQEMLEKDKRKILLGFHPESLEMKSFNAIQNLSKKLLDFASLDFVNGDDLLIAITTIASLVENFPETGVHLLIKNNVNSIVGYVFTKKFNAILQKDNATWIELLGMIYDFFLLEGQFYDHLKTVLRKMPPRLPSKARRPPARPLVVVEEEPPPPPVLEPEFFEVDKDKKIRELEARVRQLEGFIKQRGMQVPGKIGVAPAMPRLGIGGLLEEIKAFKPGELKKVDPLQLKKKYGTKPLVGMEAVLFQLKRRAEEIGKRRQKIIMEGLEQRLTLDALKEEFISEFRDKVMSAINNPGLRADLIRESKKYLERLKTDIQNKKIPVDFKEKARIISLLNIRIGSLSDRPRRLEQSFLKLRRWVSE